jgi:hypothetical protein
MYDVGEIGDGRWERSLGEGGVAVDVRRRWARIIITGRYGLVSVR